MSQASKLVSLVIPVYNEESAIPHFLAAVRPVLEAEPDYRFEFIFVNDGSRDGSLELLLAAREEDPRIRIVDFSRKRKEHTMKERLANEIIDASNNTGAAVKKREDMYKMAEANRAFSHYRF